MQKINNQYDLMVGNDNLFDYTLSVHSNFDRMTTIGISISVNYNQISFCSLDNKEFDYYSLLVEPNENTYSISVKFNTNNLPKGLNNLIVTVFVEDNLKFITNHNLIIGQDKTFTINKKPSPQTSYNIDKQTQVIFLNNTIEENQICSYNDIIEVSSGEILTLPIVFGGYEECENYIYSLLLNGKQIEFNNKFNEYFNIHDGTFAYTTVSIQVPNEPGDYELYGYLISNPYKEITPESISKIKSTISNKITIRVK